MRSVRKKNDKIILAPNSNYTDEEKQEMDDFFSDVDVFKPIVWYKKLIIRKRGPKMKIKIEDIKQIVEEVVQDAISEQEPPAEPEAAQPAVDQKADVGVVLKYIEKINNIQEYVQLLEEVLAHTPAGDESLKKSTFSCF